MSTLTKEQIYSHPPPRVKKLLTTSQEISKPVRGNRNQTAPPAQAAPRLIPHPRQVTKTHGTHNKAHSAAASLPPLSPTASAEGAPAPPPSPSCCLTRGQAPRRARRPPVGADRPVTRHPGLPSQHSPLSHRPARPLYPGPPASGGSRRTERARPAQRGPARPRA